MSTSDLVSYMTQSLYLCWLSLPPIAARRSSAPCSRCSRPLTQIQEQTLSFAIKMIVVFGVILLTARWVGTELYNFTVSTFGAFVHIR